MADPPKIPTLAEVRRAQRVVGRYLPRTPFFNYPLLDEWLGFEAFVKHENHQPVGAFKVRGGINLIRSLTPAQRRRGVIAASTGNHGLSVAYAARVFGARAFISVPRGANPGKVATMRALGARVLVHGTSFDEARLWVEQEAKRRGLRYIHSGDEPLLIAGVATYALEMFEDVADLEAILVPVGGGSGAAGCCVVAKALRPRTKVIGVQSRQAPAAYRSWRSGQLVEVPSRTFADGLATGAPFDLPQRILREHLDDFLLVSDDEIRRGMRVYLEKVRTLAEGAGAAPLAAAFKLRRRLRGKRVGIVLSGGNLSMTQIRQIVAARS